MYAKRFPFDWLALTFAITRGLTRSLRTRRSRRLAIGGETEREPPVQVYWSVWLGI